MKILTVLLVSLLLCGTAQAVGPTGEFIMPGCEVLIDETKESNSTAGYCAGVMNTIMILQRNSKVMCLPEGITTHEMAKVTLLWKKEPENLDRGFVGLAVIALSVTYPCERTAPSRKHQVPEEQHANVRSVIDR